MADSQKHPPFPNERITPPIVTDLGGWGWSARPCPICGGNAAVLRTERDAFHMCCPQCQRYTLVGPGFKIVDGWAEREDGTDLKATLSRNLAASSDPVFLDLDGLWALANTTTDD